MPEPVTKTDIQTKTDPSVANQYDSSSPLSEQWHDLYQILDANKLVILTTQRPEIGPVGRSMGTATRRGPDLVFLANNHSRKFKDIDSNPVVCITVNDPKTYDWVSITGRVTSTSNSDPRIKELYNPMISAWFGDLGDGKHDGTAKDPRMALIEVKATYITYYKKEVSTLGFIKEVGMAKVTGKVADTGVLREFGEAEIEKERHGGP